MSQANEGSSGKDPMWVVLIEGILSKRDEGYTSFHELAWAVASGMQDFEYALSECTHAQIARAFVIDQKEQAKASQSAHEVG